MSSEKATNRREFLRGKSAVEAVRGIVGPPPDVNAVKPPAAPASTYVLEVVRTAMACQFAVNVNAGLPPHGTTAGLAALDAIDDVESQLTIYRETSEVAEVNRRAADGPVVIEASLVDLLDHAEQLSELTAGAFDLTAGPLVKVWGFFHRQGKIPDEADRRAALERVGWKNVLLDRANHTVQFARPGVELNFGAIGKGYALDRAASVLTQQEVDDFLLHGGSSSVLARGRRADGTNNPGWSIGIGHPLRPGEKLGSVRLVDRALGTSGSGVQFFRSQGKRFGHILDPRSGSPAEGVLSTTVLAPDAATADALATACYVLGVNGTAELCAKRPDVGVILTTQRGGGSAVDCKLFNLGDDEFIPAEEFKGEIRG